MAFSRTKKLLKGGYVPPPPEAQGVSHLDVAHSKHQRELCIVPLMHKGYRTTELEGGLSTCPAVHHPPDAQGLSHPHYQRLLCGACGCIVSLMHKGYRTIRLLSPPLYVSCASSP